MAETASLNDQPPRGLATVKQARAYLQLSHTAVYELMTSVKLPSVRIGRSRRVPWAGLYALVARSTVLVDQTGKDAAAGR